MTTEQSARVPPPIPTSLNARDEIAVRMLAAMVSSGKEVAYQNVEAEQVRIAYKIADLVLAKKRKDESDAAAGLYSQG